MTSPRAPLAARVVPKALVAAALTTNLLTGCIRERPPQPSLLEQLARTHPITVEKNPEASAVVLTAAIQAGSAWDPLGMEGLAYQTARSLFPDARVEIADLDSKARSNEANLDVDLQIDREWVTLSVTCSPEQAIECARNWICLLYTSPSPRD